MKKKRKTNENGGITLIALVVTIAVLLILAGVSIATLIGQNGIMTQAINAKKLNEVSSEKEAIELSVILSEMEKKLDSSNKYYIGIPLQDKTVNESNWNILVMKDTHKTYGTGWNYIETETEIQDYGKTKNSWLVNYETGEVIGLEKDNYQVLSKTLAVTNGLVFNMDASNLDENTSNFGENTSFYYYDSSIYDTTDKRKEAYNEQAKYNSVSDYAGYDRQMSTDLTDYVDKENVSFNFNGNNYIEIYNSKGFDFSQGLSFEFYGNINGREPATYRYSTFCGLLGLWNGKYTTQCTARFGYLADENQKLHYSLQTGGDLTSYGSWSQNDDYPWNQQYKISNFINQDVYFTITFEPKEVENDITQKIYLNGKLLDEGWISKEYFDTFLNETMNLKYIELGRCTMSEVPNWCYTKGLCYATRIYNRGLNAEEVLKNHESTVIYRESLIK